ncbi:hypothetical protein [Streptomyces sp. NPDC056049]|uniref:hypothetical protein n=1 Tax=Streptomyces sp. NPDC056049 TaxID=3345693 RepID=UPI0035E252FC
MRDGTAPQCLDRFGIGRTSPASVRSSVGGVAQRPVAVDDRQQGPHGLGAW